VGRGAVHSLDVVRVHAEGGAGKGQELVHKMTCVATHIGVDVLIEFFAVDAEALDQVHDQLQHKRHLHTTTKTKMKILHSFFFALIFFFFFLLLSMKSQRNMNQFSL
jgi:hypothetical protein